MQYSIALLAMLLASLGVQAAPANLGSRDSSSGVLGNDVECDSVGSRNLDATDIGNAQNKLNAQCSGSKCTKTTWAISGDVAAFFCVNAAPADGATVPQFSTSSMSLALNSLSAKCPNTGGYLTQNYDSGSGSTTLFTYGFVDWRSSGWCGVNNGGSSTPPSPPS